VITISNPAFSFSIDENKLSKDMNKLLISFINDVNDLYENIGKTIIDPLTDKERKREILDSLFEQETIDRHKFTQQLRETISNRDGSYLFNGNGNKKFSI
jgi:hypothetical protein